MEKYLNLIKEKVEALKFRERLLITVTLLVLIYFVWQPLVVERLAIQKEELQAEKKNIELNIQALKKEYDTLLKTIDSSKVGTITERINKLRNFNRSLEAEIVKFTKKLIPPNKILQVLQEILQDNRSVKIVKLTNLPQSPLFKDMGGEGGNNASQAAAAAGLEIFRHGISINIEGRYFDIMEFLYKLEQLDWNLMWDSLEYEVGEYPNANVKLVLYTLSLSSDWLDFSK